MEIAEYKVKKQNEMEKLLYDLIKNWEDEVVEFKEAGKDYDKEKIGQYFSALSNEANLHTLQYGWLVFGVNNKSREIVGSDYRNTEGLKTLKHEISQNVSGAMSFIDIYEVYPTVSGKTKRVIMFQIPAAITAIPTAWKNQEYAREGESLVPLSQEKRERIRRQMFQDWSRQFVEGATIKHLNKEAIRIARTKFKEKIDDEHVSAEVDTLTDEDFLEARKLIINGKITNAAMLLLGDEQYDYLMVHMPEASWRIYDSKEMVKDYKIFKIPFITLNDRIIANIRNLTYRYMPDQMTLFPQEVKQFDTWVLRELLNNCIAHSDYSIGGRIYVNEFEDKLILTNPGSFIPKDIETILRPSYTSPFYRNQLLADAMLRFKMIDTETTGIRRVFNIQRERFFPLPDYDLSQMNKVEVTIYGKTLNDNYMHILYDHQDLDLQTVFLLDRIQKGLPVEKEDVDRLREQKLVEGRLTSLYLSASAAKSIDESAAYIKNKGFDDKYYKDLIVEYLKQYKKAKKKDIRELLWDKLPDVLSDAQKEHKVSNLLAALKKNNVIDTDSLNQQRSYWILNKGLNKS
ncbi:MAG: putative DNA binding domain-containing protein [Bacteroides sp.]|nr:putative DNA binding domain-containing protein [Bacteroides sp.]MCM1549157.1 putative DNA binding domain-containing protein [Clostridium sp.]